MVGNIYFAAVTGKLVTNHDIAKAALINGEDYVDENNLNEVREYAKKCKGIAKEVNPSIEMCLQNHQKVMAVILYREKHPGMGVKEAYDTVDLIEAKLKENN